LLSPLTPQWRNIKSSFEQSRSAYVEAISKYPNAPSLLFSYADFVEVLMSDVNSATDLRAKADMLQASAEEADMAKSEVWSAF
jgi:hypothetical protein